VCVGERRVSYVIRRITKSSSDKTKKPSPISVRSTNTYCNTGCVRTLRISCDVRFVVNGAGGAVFFLCPFFIERKQITRSIRRAILVFNFGFQPRPGTARSIKLSLKQKRDDLLRTF